MRTAIVGTGGIARRHAEAANALADRLDLVAAVDIDASRLEAFREAHGIHAGYLDMHEMLARERPDLVQICTPPGTHVDLSIACLEAGAWVLCEKPLCGSLADMDRIQAAEERSGRYCSSVFQWRFGSGGQHLRRLIQSQAMGRVLVGVCNTLWYRSPAYYEVAWRGRFETELGGVSFGQAIHIMDFLLYLLGDWSEVRAMMDTLDRAIQVEDVMMGIARFANGAMVSITNSVLSPREESYLRLDFARATVELTTLYGYRNAHWAYSLRPDASAADTKGMRSWAALPAEVAATHTSQLRALLEDMQAGSRPLVSGVEVRRTIEFLLSLYKSACTGQSVERGSIGPGDPFYHGLAHALATQGTSKVL